MDDFAREFAAALKANTPADVERVIDLLGNRVEWIPLGENPDNYGVVRMGSDPFDGLTERITNAIDAMIELEVEVNHPLRATQTPREAVERIHGFKEGNLRYCPDELVPQLATDIKVRFLEGSEPKSPTVEIIDRGIGQHPSEFPNTLLSLNRGYKVKKFYLIGAFGQGGQTSFAHSEFGIIVSRKDRRLLTGNQSDQVGWSIVRYRDPSMGDDIYKQGRWEYAVLSGTKDVPTLEPGELPIAFEHGTIIRLVNYGLPKGSSDILQPTSTAWAYLSQALFDSPLPIRLYEARERFAQQDGKKEKNAVLTGLARRLWRGGRGEKVTIGPSDSYKLDLGRDGFVRINYWALSPTNELERWPEIRRTYVNPGLAVFITLNGQRHGVQTTSFLKDRVELHYSSEHLIVQVDCDGLTKQAKKNLISATRERLVESEFTELLLDEVANHLKKDRNVVLFEKTRKEKILLKQSETDTSRIRHLVAQYIATYPELRDLIQSPQKQVVDATKSPREVTLEDEEIHPEELLTPQLREVPTFLRITNARDPIPVEKGGSALIRLECDGVDSYFQDSWEGHFRAIHQKRVTTPRSCSGLRNGKISYYVHCPVGVRVGSEERLRFELDRPDGPPLIVERDVVCVHPYERKKEPAKVRFPEPRIQAITEKGDPERWAEFGWSKRSVGRLYIGKPEDTGIFVNLDNQHLKNNLQRRGAEQDGEAIQNRYLAGVAFYLVVKRAQQEKGEVEANPSEETDDSVELDRLAKTLAVVAVPFEKV
jgi:hypothetical protein